MSFPSGRFSRFLHSFRAGLCENVAGTNHSRNCLILYITSPFRLSCNRYRHQNAHQVRSLARTIASFGYDVDVMDYDNKNLKLHKNYDLVVDLHPGGNEAHKENMNARCRKIAYITGSNPTFSNNAEKERIETLYHRKGVRIAPRRHVEPFRKEAIESCDMLLFMGNEHNLRTLDEFDLRKVFLIRNSGYEFLRNADFSGKSPRNFLFLGGKGQVHKGLDLLLDVFPKNGNNNLYVCSLYENEPDFCRLYGRELFRSSNVFPIGFVNVAGRKFRNLARACSFMILPSCSEGKAGSVLTAMSAGLIPIVTRECGFDDDEVCHLESIDIDYLESAVNDFSRKPMSWVIEHSRKSISIVGARYRHDHYRESVRTAMEWLLPTAG